MTTLKTSFNQPLTHKLDKKFLTILLFFNLLGYLVSFGVYSITSKVLEREKLKLFDQSSERVQQWVEERMLAHVNTLRGLRAFWTSSSNGVTQEEFATYLNSINLFWDYSAISSVAFVKNDNGKYVNTLIEPEEIRRQVLGNDHAIIMERKPFFDAARDSGEIISTDPFELVTTKRSGLFLIAPVYRNGASLESVTERREKLLGFIIMVFRDHNLFTAIFGRQNPLPDVDFHIYRGEFDTEPEDTKHLLYDSDAEMVQRSEISKPYNKVMRVTVGQQPWTIFVSAKPTFSLTWAEENLPKISLIVGLTISVLVSLLLLNFYRQHLKTWH